MPDLRRQTGEYLSLRVIRATARLATPAIAFSVEGVSVPSSFGHFRDLSWDEERKRPKRASVSNPQGRLPGNTNYQKPPTLDLLCYCRARRQRRLPQCTVLRRNQKSSQT